MIGAWREIVSLVADGLGILGFCIGLWTLATAKRIRREIRRRRRLPEIHRDLSEKLRQFVVARKSGDRIEARRIAKGFLRALEELKELGRPVRIDSRDREALRQLANWGNHDHSDSIEPIMYDVVDAVARLEDDG